MQVRTLAPSRAGLAGNPSDAYGGRALAVAIREFQAWAVIEPAQGFYVRSEGLDCVELHRPFPAQLGPHRLAVAACRRFFSAGPAAGWVDESALTGGFDLRYGSDIPRRVGLAGSSALAVAILRGLAARYGASIPEADLPSLALAVEIDEMGIHGGLMDRVTQVLGGLVYMDLAEDIVRSTGQGRYESLPLQLLPTLFLAWRDDLAAGSNTVHNDLQRRFERGEPDVVSVMTDLALLADEGRRLLLEGRKDDLRALMDQNFALRARIIDVGDGNRRLVEIGRRLGAGVKQAGSGGAVVGAFDGEPARLAALRRAYAEVGAGFLVPSLDPGPTADPTNA